MSRPCPKCKLTAGSKITLTKGIFTLVDCLNCGYQGMFPSFDETEHKWAKEQIDKQEADKR